MNEASVLLEKNLKIIALFDPKLAERIESAEPAEMAWVESKEAGCISATMETEDGKRLTMASKYAPMKEAEQLCSAVDLKKHGGVTILGMGLGYHVLYLDKKIVNQTCAVVVFEPDVRVLRAVFARIDHSSWLRRGNFVLADRETGREELLGKLSSFSTGMTQGTVLVTHPPTRKRFSDELNVFGKMIIDLISYHRMHVSTAMVNASRTCQNFTMNFGQYAGGANTNDLHNFCKGYPAVVVSAGPSLAKNIDLLTDPEVRKKVVVITAQTTLKPLLDRGIRPDVVTALDYHHISKRFYEGLTDLDDVTLVAEPLANAGILDVYPGPVRVTQSRYLDQMLGNDLKVDITDVPYGATVAHLSMYVAQHMGCDPILFVGQDLGFSEGLYYCPGTAIHDVWGPELNAFNTLEMLEWKRIMRHRYMLSKHEDVHGNAIYSDEQMVTYLKQFEKDFAEAKETIIDATEGGLKKANAVEMTFKDALEKYATREVPRLPLPERGLDVERLRRAKNRLVQRRDEIKRVKAESKKTDIVLEEMKGCLSNLRKMDKLHSKISKAKKAVTVELADAFSLVQELNSIGTFNTIREDRAIYNQDHDDLESLQKLQIERDQKNIAWLVKTCDETVALFDEGLVKLKGQIEVALEEKATV